MDEVTGPVGDTPEAEPAADGGKAWREVLDRLDELGDAIGRWTAAAVHDPDNRRRAEELKAHIHRIGDKVGSVIDGASESDLGQSVRGAAEKAGEAIKGLGERFGEEVAPRMASAFEAAAAKLEEAAERMENKPGPPAETTPPADE